MVKSVLITNQSRRQFLRSSFTSGALICLGCRGLLAADQDKEKPAAKAPAHKFLANAEMTYEEIFKFVYVNSFIPLMKQFAEVLGKDKLIEMIKDSSSKIAAKGATEWARKLGKNDLQSWMADFRKPNPFWQHVLTFKFVEDTPQAVELKVTECLWAKTFRDADAADFGYAGMCYGDYASAQAFNPKMKFTRTQTLMQGHPFCNHRYELL